MSTWKSYRCSINTCLYCANLKWHRNLSKVWRSTSRSARRSFALICYRRRVLPKSSFLWVNKSPIRNDFVPAQVAQARKMSIGEHRRASALLRNIQNIKICMGKKPTVSVTYKNERISIKNSLPYLKCVLRLSCVVHGQIYGRFMGFHVNGFLSI